LPFPIDDYTPHGYLANPRAVAHSWSESEGGCLRSSREYVGFGWLLPWTLRWQANVELLVVLRSGDRTLATRADFDAAGLHASHHSARLFEYRWQAFGRAWTACYTLIDRDQLGLQVTWTPTDTDEARSGADVAVLLVLRARHRPGQNAAADASSPPVQVWATDRRPGSSAGRVSLPAPFGELELAVDDTARWSALSAADLAALLPPSAEDDVGVASEARFSVSFRIADRNGEAQAIVRRIRQTSVDTSVESQVRNAVQVAREADDAFWAGAARLEGDWPASWRRGWVYDIETTRMCIYPPGGIFTDVWPAWMVQWPRAVVAEGTLDVVRLAYASPTLAKRAALSLFRDATAPNVPCVFQHGEPNMVAKDGAICGTSPAWCVPFYNLERLYAQTLDRDWLTAIYPSLARYVEWWLAERTDADGWAVYKCTWEAGEDDTPRLDPERRGDNVVSSFVRPVELQATMALSAGVLARFATVLGHLDDAARWRTVEADFGRRTRQLWDDAEGRFRDWDARAGAFLAPASEVNYWGVDPIRFSALAFTPLLAGLTTPKQTRRLREELRHYAGPPWTLWASWSYVVLESALAAGARTFAAAVANDIVARVYPELDERQIASPSHPTPGVAREFWPLDLATWEACEGYGWGANTASLLIRQIFGFLDGPYLAVPEAGERPTEGTAAGSLTFRLWPGLPAAFCERGRVYRIANLPYRGHRLTVGYQIAEQQPGNSPITTLTISVTTGEPMRCLVTGPGGEIVYRSDQPARTHALPGVNGDAYDVLLELSSGRRPAP
jgi:hypothetical protein